MCATDAVMGILDVVCPPCSPGWPK